MTGPTDSGIGYHQQFATYNQSGHDCPGPVRVNQLVHTIIPRLRGGQDHHGGDNGHSHVPPPLNPLPLPWMKKDPDTHAWQQQMIRRGWSAVGTVDGVYGQRAKTVCEKFQKEKSLPVTGKVDAHTWALAWTVPISR